jgi:hypothetical protein
MRWDVSDRVHRIEEDVSHHPVGREADFVTGRLEPVADLLRVDSQALRRFWWRGVVTP